eukprot:jgi/Psemu1/300091/fgenesh1_kg.6_\
MRSNNLFACFVWVVSYLQGCLVAEAFRSMSPRGLSEASFRAAGRRKNGSAATLLFASGDDKREETTKRDDIDDEFDDDEFDDDEELPMFVLDYNSENVDYSQLPVPPFTSGLVLLVSTAFTAYLYYVGLTGGIAADPTL